MKKIIDKSLIFVGVGLLALVLEIVIVHSNIAQLNVLTYLLTVGLIPGVILFISLLLFGAKAKISPKLVYISAIVMALIFAAVMFVYCGIAITPDVIDAILANTVTGENTQVSMSTATTGDNIQSVLIYVAFAGIGSFIGNRIRRKRNPEATVTPADEYDG